MTTCVMQVVIPLGAMTWHDRYHGKVLRKQRQEKQMQLGDGQHDA